MVATTLAPPDGQRHLSVRSIKSITPSLIPTNMSVEDNKRIVLRQFELLGAGDVEGAAGLWARESWNHGRKVGPEDLTKLYGSLRALQERHTIHEVIGEGEWVAVRTTCSGIFAARPEIPVNSGIFQSNAPNGRAYENQHIHLFRVVDGKLKEHWANRDDLAVARQIGLELRRSPT